jgi:hypothetical protein
LKKSIDGWKYSVVGSAAAGGAGTAFDMRPRTLVCAMMAGRPSVAPRPVNAPIGAPRTSRPTAAETIAALPPTWSPSSLVLTM